jgi:RNA polymerase sigma-70 factor (ECF subfamily)
MSGDVLPSELDPEVFRRAQAGDEDAFGEVVKTYYEHVFRLVRSVMRDEHASRDVCQEVWISVWRNFSKFRGDSKFTTWLHPIAVRRAIDHLRKNRKWYDRFLPFLAEDGGEIPEMPATDTNPRRDLERTESNDRFERALASLPPKHRTVLALREIQGLSYEEIATAVKCRPGTVMSRLYHARRILAHKLEEMPCE